MFSRVNYRHLVFDILASIMTVYISLFLRVSYNEALFFLPRLNKIILLLIISRAIFFLYFETYNIIWRYVSAVDAFKLAKAIAASTLVIISTTYIFETGYLPRSLYFIDSVLLLLVLSGVRISRRLYHEKMTSQVIKKFGEATLIYGAGATGQGVLKRLISDSDLKLFVIGFIDDDKLKIGKSISGFKVFGSLADLRNIIKNYEIKHVVVGMPNPSAELLSDLVGITAEFGIKPRLLNSGTDINQQVELREVELKDLLIRPPHKINITSTQEMIKGKKVLITGAGGSIGSEIVRQVLSFSPAQVIILDHSEFNLYTIDQEVRQNQIQTEGLIHPALIDLRDQHSLDDLFIRYSPEIVFHAAAYKHVHLVEANPYSSILNNIEGTLNLLNCSRKFNVEHFVQISSDKAVNPAGVMGATKRVCEIMTTVMGIKTGKPFSSVRFGNVLGSSGSLIPLLKKQIEEGKPLTITHKDMTRYFMLISEAVSLVLKAASISKAGDINVLKMGEPIRIMDVAYNLIQLMGRKKEEIEINYTGLRPGEKMFEELYISGKEMNTEHPDILVLPKGDALPSEFSNDEFDACIAEIISSAKKSDRNTLVKLGSLVNTKYFTSLNIGVQKTE